MANRFNSTYYPGKVYKPETDFAAKPAKTNTVVITNCGKDSTG